MSRGVRCFRDGEESARPREDICEDTDEHVHACSIGKVWRPTHRMTPLAGCVQHGSNDAVRPQCVHSIPSISFSVSFDNGTCSITPVALSSCRTLPPSGSAKMTTRLLLMGMFVEFVKLESAEGMC